MFGLTPDLDPAWLETRYATPPSRFITAAGLRVHVRDRGNGPVLVLLHGQSANLFLWDAAAAHLARGHRVISLDLPGHGLTGPDPLKRYSFAGLAASVAAALGALGLDRFALAGNSLGGAVATQLALDQPRRLTALLLLDPVGAPRGDDETPAAFATYMAPGIGRLATLFTPRWAVRDALADTFGDPSRLSELEVTRTWQLLCRRGNRAAGRQTLRNALATFDGPQLACISAPTLLLWGSRDHWIKPAYAAWWQAHLPDSTLKLLDGLGHQPMAEDPVATADAMTAFLAARGL